MLKQHLLCRTTHLLLFFSLLYYASRVVGYADLSVPGGRPPLFDLTRTFIVPLWPLIMGLWAMVSTPLMVLVYLQGRLLSQPFDPPTTFLPHLAYFIALAVGMSLLLGLFRRKAVEGGRLNIFQPSPT